MGDRSHAKSGKSKASDNRPALRAIAAGLSDVGLQREHNEDSYIVMSDYDLFVVADGMGGHRAGDVASKLATETISEFFRSTASDDVTWPFHFDTNLSEDENRLLTGIRVANRQIYERSTRSREYHGMGTTVVGAMFSPRRRRMYIGHVGDSRCYRVRDGKIAQLTRDHSLINDYLLAMPDLTEEQRAELPKNVITRALGMQDQVVVDLQHDEPIPGDTYILCSDGLSGMMTDDEIQAIVTEHRDIRDACKKLIALANEHGGEDNVTALLVRIELAPEVIATAKTEEMQRATMPDGDDDEDDDDDHDTTIAEPDTTAVAAITPSQIPPSQIPPSQQPVPTTTEELSAALPNTPSQTPAARASQIPGRASNPPSFEQPTNPLMKRLDLDLTDEGVSASKPVSSKPPPSK